VARNLRRDWRARVLAEHRCRISVSKTRSKQRSESTEWLRGQVEHTGSAGVCLGAASPHRSTFRRLFRSKNRGRVRSSNRLCSAAIPATRDRSVCLRVAVAEREEKTGTIGPSRHHTIASVTNERGARATNRTLRETAVHRWGLRLHAGVCTRFPLVTVAFLKTSNGDRSVDASPGAGLRARHCR